MSYKTRRRHREGLAHAVAARQPAHEPVTSSAPGASAAEVANQRLAAALEQALAEPRLVGEIVKASRSNWRAAAYLLERTYPERWAAPTRRPDDPRTQPDPFAEFVHADELEARRKRR